MSLTINGCLYRHVLSDADSTTVADLLSTRSNNESLGDLLTGISRSSDKLAQVQQSVTDLDSAISQLAICGYIRAAWAQADQHEIPLRCSVSVDKRRMGSNVAVGLKVQVVNQCAVTLSDGWSLSIALSKQDGVSSVSGWSWLGNMCKVWPLVRLAFGDHQDVIIPLCTTQLDSLPLTVSVGVSFSMTSPPKEATSDHTRTVILPLLVSVIDILHCLEPSSHPMQVDAIALGTELELARLASTRPCWQSHYHQPISASKEVAENLSINCFISECQLEKRQQEEDQGWYEANMTSFFFFFFFFFFLFFLCFLLFLFLFFIFLVKFWYKNKFYQI